MSDCDGLKIPEDDSKVPNRIFLIQNESTSSRQCMSACTVTKTQYKNRIPYLEKTFEMFSVVNFSE